MNYHRGLSKRSRRFIECFLVKYMILMERSPIKDIEIKYVLRNALTDMIDDRDVYMKGIDYSYYYEGYNIYKADEL